MMEVPKRLSGIPPERPLFPNHSKRAFNHFQIRQPAIFRNGDPDNATLGALN
jgi:hypothetical protein